LPALAVDGYLDYTLTVQGAVTGGMFYDWLRDYVLPQCNRYPGPRSVLIMDDRSTHRHKRVRELCEEYGVYLKYLPA